MERIKLLATAYYNYGNEELHFESYEQAIIWFKIGYQICSKYKYIEGQFRQMARDSYLKCKKVSGLSWVGGNLL